VVYLDVAGELEFIPRSGSGFTFKAQIQHAGSPLSSFLQT
jgi:hypothetical protein